jgi:hypothetical protein
MTGIFRVNPMALYLIGRYACLKRGLSVPLTDPDVLFVFIVEHLLLLSKVPGIIYPAMFIVIGV